MISPALRKTLVTPSKIASALDWKAAAAVLSVSVRPKGQGGIDVAVVGRNENTEVHRFSSFSEIEPLLKGPICGMVVEWPLSSNGRMGAACGSVLKALEEQKESLSSIPVCLWDPNHADGPLDRVDSFGRCANYGEPLVRARGEWTTESHNAWKRQACGPIDVWRDFARVHWPNDEQPKEVVEQYAPVNKLSASWPTSIIDKKRVLVMAKA